MNLIVDQGNTRIKVAVFERDIMLDHYVFSTDSLDDIKRIVKLKELYPAIDRAIFSSVSSPNGELIDYLSAAFTHLLVFDSTTPLPIVNNYNSPETLGLDRLASAVAANARNANGESLVIDAGTAITYDFVSKDGVYEGGGISLGLSMRFKSLNLLTNRLPYVIDFENGIEKMNNLGKNTRDSINFGVINGMIYEIEGQISYFKKLYPNLLVYFTGGDLKHFEKIINYSIFAVPFLVEEGLNRILIHYEG